jgi:hypothetical protein
MAAIEEEVNRIVMAENLHLVLQKKEKQVIDGRTRRVAGEEDTELYSPGIYVTQDIGQPNPIGVIVLAASNEGGNATSACAYMHPLTEQAARGGMGAGSYDR